jgi:hypothetical protein
VSHVLQLAVPRVDPCMLARKGPIQGRCVRCISWKAYAFKVPQCVRCVWSAGQVCNGVMPTPACAHPTLQHNPAETFSCLALLHPLPPPPYQPPQSQLLFPVPSIFGRRGGPFNSFGGLFGGGSGASGTPDNGKCEQVAAGAVSSYTAGAGPQWSCGLVADGRSSCAGGECSCMYWGQWLNTPAFA